jgi:hypothetical protein
MSKQIICGRVVFVVYGVVYNTRSEAVEALQGSR